MESPAAKPLKVLAVHRSVAHFPYHDRVLDHLCRAGHQVQVLFDEELSRNRPPVGIEEFKARHPTFSSGWSLRRTGPARRPLFASREILSYASYLDRPEQSRYYQDRWLGYLPRAARTLLEHRPFRGLLRTAAARVPLRLLERVVRPDRNILGWLRDHAPDVVAGSSVNLRFAEDIEYFKAARALGIPTVYSVLSWDNLTTKGLYHIPPDVVLAWNRTHREELVSIHRIPEDRVVITGSPFFDKWFEGGGHRPLEEFCRKVGLDPSRGFVAWLGSSKNIAADETWLIKELRAALDASARPEVRGLSILARPHPANFKVYEGLSGPGLCVWPRRPFTFEKGVPGSPEDLADFRSTLAGAAAAAGINTTGMIDAVIAGKPLIAVLCDQYDSTQKDAVHFQHLLDSGAMSLARGAAECAELVGQILAGADPKQAERERFVREFVRPHGLGVPAGLLAARAIEGAARRLSPAEIRRRVEELAADLAAKAGASELDSRYSPPCVSW